MTMTTTLGVLIDGQTVEEAQVPAIDSSFEKVPIAHAVGIPLYAKRQFGVPPRGPCSINLIVRLMSDPDVGLAPMDWQYGGALGPAPPTWLVRADGKPFAVGDWCILDEFESAMLDDGPRKVTAKDWQRWIQSEWRNVLHNDGGFFAENTRQRKEAVVMLERIFPKQAKFQLQGLTSKSEWNGRQVQATGQYQHGRIGVVFVGGDASDPQAGQAIAVKPENLKAC